MLGLFRALVKPTAAVRFASTSRLPATFYRTQQTAAAFFKPVQPVQPLADPAPATEFFLTSVLRKRRLKMKKHKLRKRRKAQRALKIRIGK